MKRYRLVLAAAWCGLISSAFGWGSLVSSFNVPEGARYPNGVAYRNGRLYISTNTPDMCFQTMTTGSIVRSHTSPTSHTMGCAAGEIGGIGYYWVVSSAGTMYRIGYNSGSIYNSFPIEGGFPFGAAFRQVGSDYCVYYTDEDNRRLYRIDALTGSFYSYGTLDFPPSGCAYDESRYFWIADGTARVIRKCRVNGSMVNSFSVASYGLPAGVGFDGTYVWVGFNNPSPRILQFEVAGEPVEPTSFGKVKAVFQ